ncbi:MAG: orotate phosphoribosyltransferase [Rickettsiales bacterium]|nr:orotate phosphoribosyltransferase [Pseudomonadota bacterium]MDA0966518.1 orotate phosphoribosyltransferase [Pseudomonadota bacterium]MDG4543380.1 orotate phosphoribosyltransferase [Rickettsiales bacterium]MDG4545646.1 orotate phosphoribosyltransferase [Rickettsiales bacterium]MDG4548095.1 orotate phosphoribosyltransferase [Rickettsiales bacterium]
MQERLMEDIENKKERLKQIIAQKSLTTGNFKLASGATSTYLFDLKTTLLDPEGASLTADLILENLAKEDVDAVGGLELGACPIVSAVCVKSYLAGSPIKSFYVRKEKKDRGSNKLIEGCGLNAGDKVVVLEDVTTKGGSVMNAIKVIQERGCKIVKVLSVVNRLEGAKENLEKESIVLDSLFTRDDFDIPTA